MPDKYIEEVLKNELAILEIDKKLKGGKSFVDKQEFEEKSLVTNTKYLDDDGDISDSQEEENDDVTHGKMQTVVDRKKIGRKQRKANEDSDVINSQQETSIQTRRRGRRKTKVEDDRKISGSDKAKCLVDGDIFETQKEDHFDVTNASTEMDVQMTKINTKPKKADEDSDVIISQQETGEEVGRKLK